MPRLRRTLLEVRGLDLLDIRTSSEKQPLERRMSLKQIVNLVKQNTKEISQELPKQRTIKEANFRYAHNKKVYTLQGSCRSRKATDMYLVRELQAVEKNGS